MIAYLDTNVFDHIYRKIGCTGADIANLRRAIYGRDLSIRLSIHTLEEILLERRASPQAFAAQIKLTLSLANSRALIKPCDQLLIDDLRAYAARGEADRPFLRGEMQNAVASGIAALIESDGEELEDEFVEVLKETARQRQEFAATFERAREAIASSASPAVDTGNFEQDFAERAAGAADRLIERAGVRDQCLQRGLDGLFRIKSVRMSLGAAIALNHEQNSGGLPPANSAALHHAVSAAAVAPTFVTDDADTHQLLARVPVDGFDIVSLPDFLKRLAT
ncbi:MAG TPA: hypothetical protein VJN94_08510 [Candidatus Binataceae bacterium]|nr:hypothetical protein [Candidatus Binataceae bacterium]